MHWVELKEEDRAPQQKITLIFVDPISIDFCWDVGKNPRGGWILHCIVAPVSCIERLIEEIVKGTKETVDCKESHPFKNYLGAKISGQVVELNYEEDGETKVEILSVKSLLKIKKALQSSR